MKPAVHPLDDAMWFRRSVVAARRIAYVWTPLLGHDLARHIANNAFTVVNIDREAEVPEVLRSTIDNERRKFGLVLADTTVDFLIAQALRVWLYTSDPFPFANDVVVEEVAHAS